MKTIPAGGPARVLWVLPAVALFWLLCATGWGQDRLSAGIPATPFALTGIDGQNYELSPGDAPWLTILYFFDPTSRSSRNGLRFLGELSKTHPPDAVRILAVTRSSGQEPARQLPSESLGFPILLDDAGISDLYGAKVWLPVTYVLKPDLEIESVLVGGGEGNRVRLSRLVRARLRERKPPEPEETFESLKRKGIDAYQREAYGEAESYLLQALSKQHDATGYLYLAYSQMELHKKAELGDTLRRAISQFPSDIRLYRFYVRFLIDQGREEQALQVLDRALVLSPDDINLKMLKDTVQSLAPEQPAEATGER